MKKTFAPHDFSEREPTTPAAWLDASAFANFALPEPPIRPDWQAPAGVLLLNGLGPAWDVNTGMPLARPAGAA